MRDEVLFYRSRKMRAPRASRWRRGRRGLVARGLAFIASQRLRSSWSVCLIRARTRSDGPQRKRGGASTVSPHGVSVETMNGRSFTRLLRRANERGRGKSSSQEKGNRHEHQSSPKYKLKRDIKRRAIEMVLRSAGPRLVPASETSFVGIKDRSLNPVREGSVVAADRIIYIKGLKR